MPRTRGYLAHDVLGMPPEDLFPAWTLAQRRRWKSARISPPMVELADTDLAAARWADQADAEWILLTPSVAAAHDDRGPARRVRPAGPVHLQWNPDRALTAAVARFVHAALTADLPPGWRTQPGHLHHRE